MNATEKAGSAVARSCPRFRDLTNGAGAAFGCAVIAGSAVGAATSPEIGSAVAGAALLVAVAVRKIRVTS